VAVTKRFKCLLKPSLVPPQFSGTVARSWVQRGICGGAKLMLAGGPTAVLAMAAARCEALQEGGKAALKNRGKRNNEKCSSRGCGHLAG